MATEGGGVAVGGTGVAVGSWGVGVPGFKKEAQALNPKTKNRINDLTTEITEFTHLPWRAVPGKILKKIFSVLAVFSVVKSFWFKWGL